MAEGAPLLREYVPKAHRGFESLRLRQVCQVCAVLEGFLGLFPHLFPQPKFNVASTVAVNDASLSGSESLVV